MKIMKNLKVNIGNAQAKDNDKGRQSKQAVKLIVSALIALAALPGFSQTRQSGSIQAENRRSVASSSYSQTASSSSRSESAFIHFRNVSSAIDRDYMDNARVLANLDRTFSDNSIRERMDYVTITGSASPDGYSTRNERLAEERALAIKSYITRKYPRVNKDRIHVYSAGEDWEGLRQMIEDDYATPGRNEALRILASTLPGDEKRRQLQQVASGRTYKYLSDNMFPHLRGGVAYMIFFKNATNYTDTGVRERVSNSSVSSVTGNMANYNIIADQVNITNNNIYTVTGQERSNSQNTTTARTGYSTSSGRETNYGASAARTGNAGRETVFNPAPVRAGNSGSETNYNAASARPRYTLNSGQQQNSRIYDYGQRQEKTAFAVKTNLLFDAATALNIELEAPIGKGWSLAGEYIFPWWLWENKQNAFELISGSLELRHWFGDRDNRSLLTGWFGGFSLGGGYYDLEKDRKGYQGEFFSPILSGGYAHEISRNGRWRMEYALGLGYIRTKYREYDAKTGYDNEWHLIYQKSGTYRYFGPVRAKVSLVFTFNSYR